MNRCLKLGLVICSCFIFSSPVTAQRMLTVEEAIAAALKSNYDILLVKNDSTAYSIDNSYAKYAFFPRLNASTAVLFNNNGQKQELADGTKRQSSGLRSSNISASLNLNWTLFDGFKMFATRDKLAEFVRLGEYAVKNQVVNTVAAVITNYYNIVSQKQQLKAILDQMSINEERVSLAEKKFSVGLGAKPELLQAKLDLNAQKAAVLQQQTLIEQLKEQLNQLTVIPVGTNYEVADSIPINTGLISGDIFSNAEKNNPSLLLAKKNIDIYTLTLKERKAERFPVVSFNSAYNFSKTSNQTVINNFTPLFNRNAGFNYGLSASIPIFNGYNTRRLIQQAQLDIDYQKIVYQNQKTKIDLAISSAFKDYDYQKKALALEEDNIVMAKENTYIAVERLRLGISTYLELRETQKTLEAAYSRLIAARYNTKVAETELLRLRGDLVK